MGSRFERLVRTVLLDTHTLLWLDVDTAALGREATRLLRQSEVAVASITWFELALLARRGRVRPEGPVRAWLAQLAREIRSVPISPAIAATAAELGSQFPNDPFDRIIYATAVEHGWQLVTKDRQLLEYPTDRTVAVW
jgi:PIN domain nuclease of toxin-antitoxin system